jgi:hypothetical protein
MMRGITKVSCDSVKPPGSSGSSTISATSIALCVGIGKAQQTISRAYDLQRKFAIVQQTF